MTTKREINYYYYRTRRDVCEFRDRFTIRNLKSENLYNLSLPNFRTPE